MKKILVACLGNIFYGDDAFGVEVAKALPVEGLPQNIKVKDFGIRGMDLAFEVSEDYDLVILVDTVKIGATAGAVFVLEPKTPENSAVLMHDLTPDRALQFAQLFSTKRKKLLLIGCEPVNLEFNSEMSKAVKNAVEKAVGEILELIKETIHED